MKTLMIENEAHKAFKLQAIKRGLTLQEATRRATSWYFELVSAGRDAVEGDLNTLKQVLQEIDGEI